MRVLPYIISSSSLSRVLVVIEAFDLASRYLKPQMRVFTSAPYGLSYATCSPAISFIIFVTPYVLEGLFFGLSLNSQRCNNCVIFLTRVISRGSTLLPQNSLAHIRKPRLCLLRFNISWLSVRFNIKYPY